MREGEGEGWGGGGTEGRVLEFCETRGRESRAKVSVRYYSRSRPALQPL